MMMFGTFPSLAKTASLLTCQEKSFELEVDAAHRLLVADDLWKGGRPILLDPGHVSSTCCFPLLTIC